MEKICKKGTDDFYLDIETVPTQDAELEAELRASVKPPGNIKKAETIDKWWAENGDTAAEKAFRDTALDGRKGELICASFALNDDEIISVSRSLGESEIDLLDDFYAKAIKLLLARNVGMFTRVIHGHKDLFDLSFLFKRSVILGRRPTFDLCQDRRANCEHVFDTMTAWAGYGNYYSQDAMCRDLGVKSPKGEMDGSKVWDYIKAGRIAEVVEYNREDVRSLRECHQLMTFQKFN